MKHHLLALMASLTLLAPLPTVETHAMMSLFPSHDISLSSGKCGENAFYTYDETTGHLDITGTGEITGGNFVVLGAVETMTISVGITSIGDHAFYFLAAVEEISLPYTLTHIGHGAFAECRSLQSLFLPSSLVEIKANALTGVPASLYAFEGTYSGDFALETGLYEFVTEVPPWAEYNNPTVEVPAWASPFVDFVAEDIMPDISPNNFDQSSTRGLIAQSIYNMCGEGVVESPLFQMTDLGSYGVAIAWCQQNGLMEGESDNIFGTENTVTREQFALILQKTGAFLEKNQGHTIEDTILQDYEDQGEISSWARDAMAWAVGSGMMGGNDNKLNPKGEISRVEVAVMLYNFQHL